MLHFPVRDGAKVIFANMGMAFLLVLAIVTFGRYYYSRSFLVTAFVMSLSWQWLGFWLLDRARLRLTVIPGSMMKELLGLRTAQWSAGTAGWTGDDRRVVVDRRPRVRGMGTFSRRLRPARYGLRRGIDTQRQ
jgi:hypothetical protein